MDIYKSSGNVDDADCVIGNSFGTSTGPGSVNAGLAYQMWAHAAGRPMIADRTLVDAIPAGYTDMAHVVEGPITNIRAQGVGTWGVLVEAHEYMEDAGLETAILVGQAYHMRRIARQAGKVGIRSVIPESLPEQFDRTSEQVWTRSAKLWVPCNALGSLLLKKRGQL